MTDVTDPFGLARAGNRSKTDSPCSLPDDVPENEQEETPRQPWTPEPGNALAQETVSRRSFLQGASLLAGGLAVAPTLAHAAPAQSGAQPGSAVQAMPLSLTINGEQKDLQVDPRISLLDLLREQLQMTGTKKGCDHGQCGACTVIANGRRINSCLSLALTHQHGEVVTVEGLAHGSDLHPVQTAFLENDGYQCGYCTPGQICSTVALLDEVKRGEPSYVTADIRSTGPVKLTADEIRERMSGNICRCGAYPGIVAAVQQAHTHSEGSNS